MFGCYNQNGHICIVFKPHCNATGLISNHKDKQYQQNKRIKMARSEFRIIRETQVNTPESLLTMANGQTVKVSCKDFSPYGTVKSAAARLNQRINKRNKSACVTSRHCNSAHSLNFILKLLG